MQLEPGPTATTLLLAANHDLDRRLQLESIKRTLPATLPADRSKPYGYQDQNAWVAFGRWMFAHGLIHTPLGSLTPPFTNEFLPGQGV